MSSSIMSFPQRGPWGKSNWRGNCSGFVYKELFEQLRPKTFCDPMVGSGTSDEVAKSMGIESHCFDLHSGFNAISDSLVNKIGKQVDFVCSHPPYGAMILYSGSVWGSQPHPADLSHCVDDADFHEKMQAVLLNQREATKPGGYYSTIIGDYRKNGKYVSYQSEILSRMPSDELAAVLIKAQHNVQSDSKQYASMSLPRIVHEYILLWRRRDTPTIILLGNMAREQFNRVSGTWKNIVRTVLSSMGGKGDLQEIYQAVASNAPVNVANNENWKAKVRQILNSHETLFKSNERGVWQLA